MKRFVIDTCTFINYHCVFFNERDKLSKRARGIIDSCYNNYFYEYKLIIPSIVFIEIRRTKLDDDEVLNKFKFEVYLPTRSSDNINIRELDSEVMNTFFKIDDLGINFERIDKIILATAIVLDSTIISYDSKIVKYSNRGDIVDLIN